MKYALVTGASKGIGKAITLALLEKGYFVVITYATGDEAIAHFRRSLGEQSDRFFPIKVDHSDRESIYKLIEQLKEILKYINCIVCNVGKTVRKDILSITDKDWDEVMEVSLTSHFLILRELFPLIAPDSRIIFIGSMMGKYPHATSLVYGVSKAAVHGLAQNLVKEFVGTGTTVNTILPGFVETEWQVDKPAEIRDRIKAKTAIGRFATTAEIAHACMFCVDNAFVNGTLLEVSGGYAFR